MKHQAFLLIAILAMAVGCTQAPDVPATEPARATPAPESTLEASPTPDRPLDPVDGVKRFQALAGLPDSKPTFSENVMMANSPSGAYKMMIYKDADGRVYSVDPATFNVVELDARSLLDSYMSLSVRPTEADLEARAVALATAASPEFAAMKDTLTYQPGKKDDLYFYDWRGELAEGKSQPSMVQVALHAIGQLVAFYHTLGIVD